MKTVIQARRVEFKSLDLDKLTDIWYNQTYSVLDYFNSDIDYYVQNKVRKGVGDIYKKFAVPQKLGVYKDRRGKIWLTHHFNYVHYGVLEDLLNEQYGFIRIENIIREFKCKRTSFIQTLYVDGKSIGGARYNTIMQQGDRYILGAAKTEYVRSLKDVRIYNVLSKIHETGELVSCKEITEMT